MNPPKEILLDLHISPPDLFSAILENSQDAFLLESSEGPKKLARFSFIGFLPYSHMSLKNGCLKIDGEETDTKNPLLHLKNEVGKSSFKGQGFLGGAVGYFSFDYVRYIENFQSSPNDEVNFPDFEFGMFSDAVVFDHRKGTIKYIYSNENRLELLLSYIKDASFSNDAMQMYNQKCKVGKEKFLSMVNTAKEYIKAGEIFQVVLSNRYEIKFVGSLVPFYKKLKAINPSPYLYYLKFGDRQLIGSSPENLFRLEGKEITSYATIAGTRPRGKTKEEDEFLERELLSDEKERAEHLMLVDLTRNDIGRVAKIGSISVPEIMSIHKYSHVQHLVSLVKAKISKGKDSYDIFNSIFPAGTVSGAPKIRAIEIIDELEGTSRGPYAGAVGYFSPNGNADFAIAIRTLFASKNRAYVQAGAGIVYDSIPEKEFEEIENKSRSLLHALGEDRYLAAIGQ